MTDRGCHEPASPASHSAAAALLGCAPPMSASGRDAGERTALDLAEREVVRTVRRLGLWLAVRGAMRALTVAAALWGVLLLALRAGAGVAPPDLGWGVALAVATAGAGALAGWRRRPAAALLRGVVESRRACGGLLLAAAELDVGAWRHSVPAVPPLRLSWRWQRTALALGAAMAFAAASVLVPAATSSARAALDLSGPAAGLAARLDVLAALDEKPAEVWREELGKAIDLAAAGETERAWQTLDAVAAGVDEAQQQHAEAALAQADRLSRAAAALAAAKGDRAAGEGVPGTDTAESTAAASPAGADATAAATDLRRRADAAARLAAALQSGKPVDASSLRREGLDENALAEFLSGKGEGEPGGEQSLGRGGVDRGRGDAPYLVKEPAHNWGLGFDDQPLPPAAVALETSIVLSTDAAEPLPDPRRDGAGGALAGARPDGGAAFTELVLPRHRAAVRRYFTPP